MLDDCFLVTVVGSLFFNVIISLESFAFLGVVFCQSTPSSHLSYLDISNKIHSFLTKFNLQVSVVFSAGELNFSVVADLHVNILWYFY